MTHNVTWQAFRWDPITNRPVVLVEHNQDRPNTWGMHLEYERPLSTNGWRRGWLGTVNRHSHPKIPNYQIQNIPRDPGTTWAYNLGFGLGRHIGPASFGHRFHLRADAREHMGRCGARHSSSRRRRHQTGR